MKRSSSQICCHREDCHLKYVTFEKIIISTKRIFISNRLQWRRFSSQYIT
uniref:Uncharacterized protein n=1 Tax=Cucumis melo TaxID=3656 RepID=A0A9I9CYM8_CUCME